MEFQLTKPENRTYLPDESYRFLIHVPLGDVSARMNDIGPESIKPGALMTSLVTNEHQGTFLGRSGIIVDQPISESVIGSDRDDIGAEIPTGHFDSVEELTRPATPFGYNQIDMKFNGTKPVGVMIKCDANGEPIGDANSNASLEEYARTHNLPIVKAVIESAHVPTKPDIRKREFSDGKGSLDTITVPYSDTHFLRVDIRRMGDDAPAYHTAEDQFSRTLRVDVYGQTSEALVGDENDAVLRHLKALVKQDILSNKDIDTVVRDITRSS